jgi:hypothetical protein
VLSNISTIIKKVPCPSIDPATGWLNLRRWVRAWDQSFIFTLGRKTAHPVASVFFLKHTQLNF